MSDNDIDDLELSDKDWNSAKTILWTLGLGALAALLYGAGCGLWRLIT